MWMETYKLTVLAMGATGLMLLLQMLVVDFAGMAAKHQPGHPVTADHGNFLFRAVRAQANTNESVAVFMLLALFGMMAGASASWLGYGALVYAAGRLGHMLCYYAGAGLARSTAFGVALMGLLAMALAAVMAMVQAL